MVRLRRLLAGTTVLTGLLLLLGIYTAASGAGLACAQRWPFCDGAVFGLFPATVPSFVEWSHRLVAMVTGFAILGVTYAAWRRGGDRPVRYATAVATVLLPAQVLLGAETVFSYTLASRALHFVTALTIFSSLVAATAWTYPVPDDDRLTRLLWIAGVLALAAPVLGPRGPVGALPLVQTVLAYAVGLTAFAVLVAVAIWLPRSGRRGTARVGALAAATLVAATLTLRRLVYTDLVPLADLAATAVAVSLVLAAVALLHGADSRPRGGTPRSS